MKKRMLAVLILLLTLFAGLSLGINSSGIAAQARLECTDVSGCSGSKYCSGSGTISGCTLTCSDGTKRHCSTKEIF